MFSPWFSPTNMYEGRLYHGNQTKPSGAFGCIFRDSCAVLLYIVSLIPSSSETCNHRESILLSLSISIEEACASRPRGARARKIHFLQILYSTSRRTSHHTGGPRNFDKLVISGPCGAFQCVCMLLQNSQNTKGAGSV